MQSDVKLDFRRLNNAAVSVNPRGMNSPNEPRPATSNFRWIICALLFFSTTFNYLDRQVISYLKEYFCTPVEMDCRIFEPSRRTDFNLPDFAAEIEATPRTR